MKRDHAGMSYTVARAVHIKFKEAVLVKRDVLHQPSTRCTQREKILQEIAIVAPVRLRSYLAAALGAA